MSKLTFDEAIQLYTQRAENHEYILHSGEFIGEEGEHMKQDIKCCVSENRQLAEWLTELKEAKRLLKAAVDGYRFIGYITKDYACPSATSCSACPMDEGKQCRIWEHADEALALIGEDGENDA